MINFVFSLTQQAASVVEFDTDGDSVELLKRAAHQKRQPKGSTEYMPKKKVILTFFWSKLPQCLALGAEVILKCKK